MASFLLFPAVVTTYALGAKEFFGVANWPFSKKQNCSFPPPMDSSFATDKTLWYQGYTTYKEKTDTFSKNVLCKQFFKSQNLLLMYD